MSKPSPETEQKAWDAVVPNMFKLKEFCDYSNRMGPIVSKIFKQICAPGELTLVERLDTNQALLKQLSKILDAVFKLDEFKMIHSGTYVSVCLLCWRSVVRTSPDSRIFHPKYPL